MRELVGRSAAEGNVRSNLAFIKMLLHDHGRGRKFACKLHLSPLRKLITKLFKHLWSKCVVPVCQLKALFPSRFRATDQLVVIGEFIGVYSCKLNQAGRNQNQSWQGFKAKRELAQNPPGPIGPKASKGSEKEEHREHESDTVVGRYTKHSF